MEVEKPDLGHRRAAIQVVAQLPETQAGFFDLSHTFDGPLR